MRFFRKIFKPLINKIKGIQGEKKVKKELNPLFDFSTHKLINGVRFICRNGYSIEIDHIDIRKNGIFCIETKNYSGKIYGSEQQENWVQCLNNNQKNYFYNPLKQNYSHINQLKKELDYKYEINSIIVFVQDNADKVEINNVVNLCDLKNYLKNFNNGKKIYSKKEIKKIYNILMMASDNEKISHRQHIKNIKKRNKNKK